MEWQGVLHGDGEEIAMVACTSAVTRKNDGVVGKTAAVVGMQQWWGCDDEEACGCEGEERGGCL